MQTSMRLRELLKEVIRQDEVKKDFVTSTRDNIRVQVNAGIHAMECAGPLILYLLRDGREELERFDIAENAHRQIAGKLSIPWKYYGRLLEDHPDLVADQINALFEREPKNALVRVLDGRARAFLSDRYLRLDNGDVLKDLLPVVTKGIEDQTLRVMSSHVDDQKMHMKVIFTGDDLAHEVARTGRGEPRIIRPGFRLSNSETGRGSLRMEGFFYDSYCTNGCVFGREDAFSFNRTHLGGRLIEGDGFEVISDETRKLEDAAVISAVRDGIAAISDPAKVAEMADSLRRAHNSERVKNPVAAVELAVKELDLRDSEREGILQTFLRDMDYSQYGLAAAITEQANNAETCSYSRACELEDVGAKVLSMGLRDWNRLVVAEAA